MDRFEGLTTDERAAFMAELESQINLRGERLLKTPELEALIQLLPSKHFHAAFKAGVGRLRARRESFADKISDFKTAVRKIFEHCRAGFACGTLAEKNLVLRDMEALQLSHPAMWYRVYEMVKAANLAWAMELEPKGQRKPFKRP